MSEANMLRRVQQGVGKRVHWCRVENMVGVGIPDVNYCLPTGVDGWIEGKFRKDPPARETTPAFTNGGLRDDQIIWIRRRIEFGGRVHILAQVGDELLLIPGKYATEFNSMSVPYLRLAAVWIGRRNPDWESFVHALRK